MESEKIIIGITHGDINGIGYEVILKAFSDNVILDLCTPIIYGSSKVFGFYKKQLDIQSVNYNQINSAKDVNHRRLNLINCVDDEIKVELGISTQEAGKAAFSSLERATEDLKAGHIHAIVTAPINKHNIQSDKFQFPGHTEYLEGKFAKSESALMMLTDNNLRVAVVTGHIPLNQVAKTITEDLILKKLQILNQSLKQDFMIVRPRIAVLGLNPHAGDQGVIGEEEEKIIIPAIKKAESEKIQCFGPYPADGFFGAGRYKEFDAVLAMYHDQGLIPFKTIAMDSGVNYTAGLPVIRTSPDHGTAYNIAGKNKASELSLLAAIYLAIDVSRNRKIFAEMHDNPLPITETKNNKKDQIE
ncbi:MAG TPA: 4-hydroxythreonine-4-phosphate dehydrogenase PdxA [Bacteroidales bacterium]|nr:4-hydroxythreonine-4-phosphate dehydrogenase PdxA [Bacteroidales bacterium]